MRAGGLLLVGCVACSSFGSGTGEVTADAGTDSGDAASSAPGVFKIPCGSNNECTDKAQHCCANTCQDTSVTCPAALNDWFCNDPSDCAAAGRPGQLCCGHIEAQNMVSARCAVTCTASEVSLCDPNAAGACPAPQSCLMNTSLNEGGFASCQ